LAQASKITQASTNPAAAARREMNGRDKGLLSEAIDAIYVTLLAGEVGGLLHVSAHSHGDQHHHRSETSITTW
jgi:hypothetical protein